MRELHTESFTAEREWTVEGIPVLYASISLPQPEPRRDKVSRRIYRYYQLQCRAFLRYCESWLLPQAAAEYHAALAASVPLPEFRAELEYHVTYQESGLWSVFTQTRERTGTGPALLTRRGDTWDLTVGYPVPIQDFFPPGTPWKKRLLTLAASEIERRERAGVSHWHEGWRKEMRRHFNPQNYYLTEEGLTFFYPMYAIAPAFEGIPTFVLPYREGDFTLPNGERVFAREDITAAEKEQ